MQRAPLPCDVRARGWGSESALVRGHEHVNGPQREGDVLIVRRGSGDLQAAPKTDDGVSPGGD